MCNGHYEGAKIFEVAVVVIGLFEQLEFDHVAIVAVGKGRWGGVWGGESITESK